MATIQRRRAARFVSILYAIAIVTGVVSAQSNITLEAITIYKTHEWLGKKPNLYFQCKGEEKVDLPDVKEKDRIYRFIGHESWQPLTSLEDKKCKRCGVYEANEILKDGTFDEWEFCLSGFDKGGHYVHLKTSEFNATFVCSDCSGSGAVTEASSPSTKESSANSRIAVAVVLLSFLMVLGIGVVGYMKWKKKHREEQQARFIKLFEEDEDFELEMGLQEKL